MTIDADTDICIQLERELLTPTCRANAARLRELLADDFVEFGASGRVWDRPGMLAALANDNDYANDSDPSNDTAIEDSDMAGQVLADGLVLLTYRSTTRQRSALRTSLWRRDRNGWQVFFHQGTVIAPGT